MAENYTVQDVVRQAQGFAADAVREVNQVSDRIMGMIGDISRARFDFNDTYDPGIGDYASDLSNFLGQTWMNQGNFPNFTARQTVTERLPEFVAQSAVDTSGIEIPNIAPPAISLPAAPSISMPSAPVAPDIFRVELPEITDPDLPTAPTLAPISMPTFAGLNLPTFSAIPPALNITQPVLPTPMAETVFDSPGSAQALAWADDILSRGGSGIRKEDEERLLRIALDQADQEVEPAVSSLSRSFQARGFHIPPGAMAAAQRRLRMNSMAKRGQRVQEWHKARVEATQRAAELSLNQIMQFAVIAIPYHSQMADRALNLSKAVAEWAIALHNTEMETIKTRLAAYDTEARVFLNLLQAETQKVQVFEAQVRAAQAEGQINEQQVRIYTAQIEAAKAYMDMQGVKIKRAETAAAMQKLTLDAFREEVQAYSARVDANVKTFNLHMAKVDVEGKKMDMYHRHVDAVRMIAATAKDKAETKLTERRLKQEEFSTRINAWKAHEEAQRNNYLDQLHRLELELKKAGLLSDEWRNKLSGWESLAKIHLANAEAIARHAENKTQQETDRVRMEMTRLMELAKISINANTQLAVVRSEQIKGAMAGITAVVSGQ